jgi:peptidyl-prolyl cis-trans isomerase C
MRAVSFAAVGIGFFMSAWQPRPVRADAPPSETTVVAKVGPRGITVGELNRRIAALPPFQLRGFGRNENEIRRNFLEKVLIREALLSQGALDDKLSDRDDVKDRVRGVLRSAMLGRVRAETVTESPVTEEDVKRYYDANPSKFHTPARISIWRILVDKRDDAVAILKEIQANPTPKRWNEITRDKSVDGATRMRSGNLGFVAPDGTTAEPGIKVDAAIIAAVAGAPDGKILPEPVQEGDRYAVVWRRQSMKAVDRPLEIEAASIRQVLTHEKAEKRTDELLTQLRKDHLKESSPELVDAVEIAPSGELQAVPRPGTLPPKKPSAAPAPTAGPGGVLR